MNSKALAVVSGGMDSITMLHEFRERIGWVVSFDYGSKHNHREIPWAAYHSDLLGKPHTVLDIKTVLSNFKSHLLKGQEEIPEGHYEDPVMKQTVVPFRNGIMLSIAAGLAESLNLKQIMMANHFGDHAIYPDCRADFIEPMRQAIKHGTYAEIELAAPYTSLTKRDIALRGREQKVDYTTTWSCYKGGEIHCGKCGTCIERKEALEGFDSTEYLF